MPAGTWEDDDLRADVDALVGTRRDRKDDADDDGADRLDALCRLAARLLDRPKVTPAQQGTLRTLVFGGDDRSGHRKAAAKASVITRQLLAWRHDLTDPAVRRMQHRVTAGRPPVTMIFR